MIGAYSARQSARWALHRRAARGDRDADLWAFGAWRGSRFTDNSRWLFLHMLERHEAGEDVPRPVWIARAPRLVESLRDAGLPAYDAGTREGIRVCMDAGVHVTTAWSDDTHAWAAAGAVQINLGTGIPLKRIHADAPGFKGRRWWDEASKWERFMRPTPPVAWAGVAATSREVADRLAGAYETPRDLIGVTGYPRNDVLFQPEPWLAPWEQEAHAAVAEARRNGKQILYYLPTQRPGTGPEGIPIDWRALDAALERHDGLMVVKLHPADHAKLPAIPLPSVRFLDTHVDPYPFVALADALVTDYSSVMFDHLLTGSAVLLYPYDLATLLDDGPGLYEAYDSVAPGPQAGDWNGFLGVVGEFLTDPTGVARDWGDVRKGLVGRMFDAVDGRAGGRVVGWIRDLTGS